MKHPPYDPSHEIVDAPPLEEDEGLSLRDYWNIIYKRLWIVALVLVLSISGGLFYTFKQPKIYEAKTTIIIEPEASGPLSDLGGAGQMNLWFLEEALFETQIKIIQSRHVAEGTVQELGLAENLTFLNIDHIEDEVQLARSLEQSDPAKRVMSILSVEPVKDTRMLTIKIRHQDPEIAALVADGVAKAYQAQNIERRVQNMRDAFNWLEEQYETYKTRLEVSRKQLHDFIKDGELQHHLISGDEDRLLFTNPNQQQALLNSKLQDLNHSLINIEQERRQVGNMLDQFRRFKVEFLNTGSLSSFINSETLTQFAHRYVELKQEEAFLNTVYLEDHPKVRTVREQIILIEGAIRSEVKGSRELYRRRHLALKKSEEDLSERIKAVQEQAFKLEKLKLLYEQLENQKEEQQRLFELVQRRMNEVNLSRLLENNNVRILDRAEEPPRPFSPRPALNLAISIIMGLVGGIGLTFLLEWLDHTVKTQEDIERFMPFLGVLPIIRKDDHAGKFKPLPEGVEYRRDLHTFLFPRSSAAECMRTIRTNLLFMSPGQDLHTILVTSPSPLEGKTTCAISLATVMAQSSRKVLIVDLDLRRPRLHKGFGLFPERGISDVLIGAATLEESILPTTVDRLDILPCGTIPPNPSELFHTQEFLTLLEELKSRYDRIIIDSPPIIAVTDSLIIAQHIDGMILVCRSNSTRKELLHRSTQLIRGVNAPLLGVVLNHVDLRKRRQGNYYYYYYREHGQYYGNTDEEQI